MYYDPIHKTLIDGTPKLVKKRRIVLKYNTSENSFDSVISRPKAKEGSNVIYLEE